MSGQLAYDGDDLRQAADRLEESVVAAREVERDSNRMADGVSDCGHHRLAGAARNFLDGWGYGMGVVATDAEGLAKALRAGLATYQAVDQDLASRLEGFESGER